MSELTPHPVDTTADLGTQRLALRTAFEAATLGPREAALAAEALGDTALALRAWQIVLRDTPEDGEAWRALAELHELRGDTVRAQECRRRAGGVAAVSAEGEAPASPPELDAPSGAPTDADLIRFNALFAGREGVHARMWRSADGRGYSPVERTLGPDLLRHHLSGEETLGIYVVRVDDTVTLCCFDLDVTKAAMQSVLGDATATRQLRSDLAEAGVALVRRLREVGLDPLFVDSGWKGRHAWCFLPSPRPASEVLAWGQAMLAALRPRSTKLALEFFPKQARVGPDGLGNLVKLPLGLHLVSGRRAVLLDDSGVPLPDPWPRLRSVRRVALPAPLAPLPPGSLSPSAPEVAPFAPAPGPADWTEADFEASPEVGPVYRGCPVIRSLVEQAVRERRLSRDEAVVLEHSLGHGPDGVRAVNYTTGRIPGWPAELRMQSPHRGSPVSCARVRQRVPGHARRVGCDCAFALKPGEYANPLLHRAELHPKPRDPGLDDTLEQLARAEDRLRTVRAEVAALRARAAARLAEVPGHRWAVGGGEWALVEEDGVPQLRWTAS